MRTGDEDDIDALLAKFTVADKQKKAVKVENDCAAPSGRVNASFTPYVAPKVNDIIMFGGEYCNIQTGKLVRWCKAIIECWNRKVDLSSRLERKRSVMLSTEWTSTPTADANGGANVPIVRGANLSYNRAFLRRCDLKCCAVWLHFHVILDPFSYFPVTLGFIQIYVLSQNPQPALLLGNAVGSSPAAHDQPPETAR